MRRRDFMAVGCGVMLGLVVLFGIVGTIVGDSSTTRFPLEHAGKQEKNKKAEQGRYDAVSRVKEVEDGNTVRIDPEIDGANEGRVIGVDTPDIRDFDAEEQPYGNAPSGSPNLS